MGLREYAFKRVISGFITLIIVMIFNWIIFRLPTFVSGLDPAWFYILAQVQAGSTGGADPRRFIAELIKYKERWKIPNVNAPFGLWVDHLIAYMINMFTFNFGISIKVAPGRQITKLLASGIVFSVFLLLPAEIIAIFIGISLGVKLGANPGSKFDVIMMSLALMLFSIPTFWLQVLLKFVFTVAIPIWPARGTLQSHAIEIPDPLLAFVDAIFMLLLPIITLVLAWFAGWMLLMRGSLMDVMGEDYILTAKAKGLDEVTILYKHAMRNAILPVVTGVILAIAGVWTGAVITETIFSIPGVGWILLQSILLFDYPVLETTFYFIALTTIVANIIADISYALLDPRVKY